MPGKPNLIYSDSQGGYIYITDIHSGNVRSIHPYPAIVGSAGDSMEHHKYRFNWDPPIHISPHDPGTVYYGGNVLFKSTNYGHSWEEISPDLTTDDKAKQGDSGGEIYNDNTAAEFHCTIITIAEDRIEPGVTWTGSDDGLVHVTRDGGANWLNVTAAIPDLPAETWIAKIDASHHTAGTAYIAVDNHRMNDFTSHAYRCTDYGANCEDLAAGLPQNDYVKVIREDQKNPNVLYVGMERGLYASWDGGETWHDIRLNLPRVSVRDIKIHPRENDLIIGTHGRGAFILDDLTPIQNLAAAMNEDVYLFDVRRATRWTRWNQDASRGQRSWAGANPPAGAIISFYIKEAPIPTPGDSPRGSEPMLADRPSGSASSSRRAGPVKIRITDFTGALVREITHRDAKPGINRIAWNLIHTGPRPLQSREDTGGFFRRFFGSSGPPAVPGTYTATLTANGQEMSTRFEVRGDPRVEMSMAEYRAQTDAAFKVRDLTSPVNELIDTVHDLNEQLDNLNGRLEDADVENLEQIVEQTGTALAQLRDLDNKLQRPFPRMGYRQYPRLSEELSSLNRRIIQALAPPTEGQLTRLAELDQETTERAAELNEIISTTIEELNQMLIDYQKIIVGPGGWNK